MTTPADNPPSKRSFARFSPPLPAVTGHLSPITAGPELPSEALSCRRFILQFSLAFATLVLQRSATPLLLRFSRGYRSCQECPLSLWQTGPEFLFL